MVRAAATLPKVTRLIAVFGASPGLGKSTLTRRLAEEASRVGRVDRFDEEHVLSRREFARRAMRIGRPGTTVATCAGIDGVRF